MDELALLRRLDADTPLPSTTDLAGPLALLEQRIALEERRGAAHRVPRRGRRVRRALIAGAGVAALVTGLVLTDAVGVAGLRPGASAEAAEVLERAADLTVRTSDPVVRPGQYLEITTTSRSMSTGGTPEHPQRWMREGTDTTWIPHDRSDEWVLTRTPQRPVAFLSDAARTEALEGFAEQLRAYDGRDELLRGRNGDFFGTPADEVGFDDLPRDPRVLLNRIYRTTLGQGHSPDQTALDWIASQLRSGVVPADLRAALYRAAALIPAVTLTDARTVLDGRTGTAIGRVEPLTGERQEIVVDPGTGLLIGERTTTTREVEGIPADWVVESTAVRTAVVDAAPSGPEHRVQ